MCKIAEGAVVGSSIIKIIENNPNDKANMIEQLGNFVKDLKEGTKKWICWINFVKPKLSSLVKRKNLPEIPME